MDSENIEKRVSDTILQQSEKIKIGDKEYEAAPPSIATLILVSEAVSRLPHLSLDSEHLVEESVSIAKDCRVLGDIAALLILGAKHIKGKEKARRIKEKRYLWGWLKVETEEEVEIEVNYQEKLATEILETLQPAEFQSLISRLLLNMQLGDFFGVTTFLTEINLIRKTKVEN